MKNSNNKRKKTICIIRSNSVNPDSRVEKEAATLKKAGYNVVILAWDRSGNHRPIKSALEVYGENVEIYRLGYKASYGAGMKSIIPYMRFQLHQFGWLIANRKNIDIIHACDFDTALFSSIANFFLHKKFVFDIFDFICGSPENVIQSMVKNLQIKIINVADATIICTEKRKMQIKDATPTNLTIIHNTPIKINFEGLTENKSTADVIKVAYVGVLQDYRLLTEMTETFKCHSEIELHIGGFGKYESFFKQLSEEYENIKFYGKLSYMQTLELEQKCDIMLAIYDPQIENHRYAAPNKFYESLMLGKPVLMVRGTGMSEYVNEFNIGKVIEYSAESFEDGIAELISKRNEWEDMGRRMKELYEEKFGWNVMGERLKKMYSIVINGEN